MRDIKRFILLIVPALLTIEACQKKTTENNATVAAPTAGAKLAASITCSPDDGPAWVGKTPEPMDSNPGPHAKDCVFYKASWQHFLFATQPDGNNHPAFTTYDSVDTLLGGSASPLFPARRAGVMSATLRVTKLPNSAPGGLPLDGSGVRQAGAPQGILIDQAGHPIYYAIHLNSQFATFIRTKKLTNALALQNADPQLEFPKGTVELKSAWQIVDGAHPIVSRDVV